MEKAAFKLAKLAGLTAAGLALVVASFAAGRLSASPTAATAPVGSSPLQLIQNDNDPRELIPLPGQGDLPGQGEGECPLYLYQDGQLFQFNAPGVPGQPGGEGSPELFPLEPRRAPGSPGTPQGPRNLPGTQLSQLAPLHLAQH